MKILTFLFSFIITLSLISTSYAYWGGRGGYYNRPFIGGYGPGFYRPYMGYRAYPDIYYSSPIISYSYIERPAPIAVKRVVREIVVPTTEYIELPEQKATASKKLDDADYWYYCRKTDAYYPKVETCSSGWMQVLPHDNK